MTETTINLDGRPVRKLSKKRAHQAYFTKDGKRVKGCSSICKVSSGDNVDGLISWGVNLYAQGIDFRKARDEAAEVGQVAHFLMECFIGSADVDLSEFSPHVVSKAQSAFGRAKDWWNSQNLNALYSELQLVSNEFRFGGTLDTLAVDENTELVLLDWKFARPDT